MNAIRPMAVAVLLLCLTGVAAGDPPKVVRSDPADGATGIPADVAVIRVWFDRNMNQATWTFGTSHHGQFPPMDGANDAPWRDPRCVELKIKPLQPDTTYAVTLNTAARRGFRSADGDEPLAVTTITFTTARAALPEPPGRPPAGPVSPLAGTWLTRAEQFEVSVTFRPDGTFVRDVRADGQTQMTAGTWKLDGNRLTIKPQDEDEPVTLNCRFLDANTVEVTDADGDGLRMVRQGAAPTPPAPTPGPSGPPGPAAPVGPPHNRPIAPDLARLALSESGHILFVRHVIERHQVGEVVTDLPVAKIYIMNGDGTAQAPFIVPPRFIEARHAAWAPGGKAILFTSPFEMARSVLFADIFLADLTTGSVIRVTGNEPSVGPAAGTGSIHGVVEDNTPSGRHKDQVHISVQGGNGIILHPDGYYKSPKDEKEGAWGFRINNVPAGQVWVKIWVNKHLGAWRVAHVPFNGIGTVEMNIIEGNLLATNPSITPDGRYVVGLWQHAFYNEQPKAEPGSHMVDQRELGFDTIAVFDRHKGGLPVAMWQPTRMQGQLSKDPKLSPDGRWIAFSMGAPPNESIAVCSLEGMLAGQPQVRVVVPGQLILGGAGMGHVSPAWSPDGRRIALVRYASTTRGFTGNVFVVNADGSGLTQVTRLAANQCAASPCFSPDGRRIAFQLVTSRGKVLDLVDLLRLNIVSDIWTIGADGANPRQLTNDGRCAEPAWGP